MNTGEKINAVTGAYGYLGKYIARELLVNNEKVLTLTGHPSRPNEFGDRVKAAPFNFDNPKKLTENLRGVHTLYNTYWVRFDRGDTTYERAVSETEILIKASREAGVERFVHISITNPRKDSPFPYFSGKARIEEALADSGLSYAIVRPTVLFGKEDILINNIAWLLRRLPLFGILGKGDYSIQPALVDDVAKLAVDLAGKKENVVVDAVGPEIFSFTDMVKVIKKRIGSRALLVKIPPFFGFIAGKILGALLGDVLITREEIGGLMAGLLVSDKPPTCPTRFSDWVSENSENLGRNYSSEVARHYAD